MLSLEENPRVNHVRQIAEYFEAEIDESYDASIVTMSNDKAKGFISSYQIYPGLLVWVYNIVFQTEFKVNLELAKDGPYYFSYNVKGNFLHRFLSEDKFSDIKQNQHMIVIGRENAAVEIVFPAKKKLEIAVIVLDNNLLGNQNIRNAQRMHTCIQHLFEQVLTDSPFRHIGSIDTATKEYASIVCENKKSDIVGELLTEGAVFNMFASQIEAFNRDINEAPNKSNLMQSELSRITTIGDYILKNLDNSPTVKSISKEFGFSPGKLQKGVKFLYGDTVGRYIFNLRMGEAKRLLEETNRNISEICFMVGLSSRSYFSKVFRERYGINPGLYRNSVGR